MSFELFQQGPDVYVPILIVSLFITVAVYGMFPIIFSMVRIKPITKKKYLGLCYGINFLGLIGFIVLNGGAISGAPYLLWTWVFSRAGVKKLTSRELLLEKVPEKTTPKASSKKPCEKNKLIVFTNVYSIALSITASIFVILSMNTQDYEKNLNEPCNPTIIYAILLSILILILGFSIISLIRNRFKLVAFFSSICVIATTAAIIENSIISKNYYSTYLHRYVEYHNADILDIYNTLWIAFVFLIFIVTLIPVIVAITKNITYARYHSISYRENCYKRVSKMKEYLDQGIITEEEFTKNKQEILKNIKM